VNLDPQQSRAILEAVLTLAGGTVAGAILAQLISVLKRLGGFGTWIENGHEYVVNLVLSALLLGYAAAATGYAVDLVSGFGLFIAWLGLAGLTDKAYQVTPDGVSNGLSGAPS